MKRYSNPDPQMWAELCRRPVANALQLDVLAAEVFANVRAEGDIALRFYTKKFDKVDIENVVVSDRVIMQEAVKTPLALCQAIDRAYENVKQFHELQKLDKAKEAMTVLPGVRCWREARPIERVGLYVPGGTAPLISTVLMLGVPAQIAGCKRIIVATPPDTNGSIAPAICYAAQKIGATDIIRVGGMQAIAAMTLGTDSVPIVDKLFGPGNQYVTAAKQYATKYGAAIDMPAGPSELLVIADDQANPAFVAADLLSQAEHGVDSQVVLVTTSTLLAQKVERDLEKQLASLPRRAIAQKAIENSFGVVVPDLQMAVAFANTYAPEHLILNVTDADSVREQISNAGSVFLGAYSPESAGDYASGTNHTLPTNGWARSYSGVSLDSFTKKVTFQRLTRKGLTSLAGTIETLARAEGLEAHARAVSIRKTAACVQSEGIGE